MHGGRRNERNGASPLSLGDDKANEESGGACSADRGELFNRWTYSVAEVVGRVSHSLQPSNTGREKVKRKGWNEPTVMLTSSKRLPKKHGNKAVKRTTREMRVGEGVQK